MKQPRLEAKESTSIHCYIRTICTSRRYRIYVAVVYDAALHLVDMEIPLASTTDFITPAGRELLDAVAVGRPLNLLNRTYQSEPVVNAELIRRICIGETFPVHAHGIQLTGAVIVGGLDFTMAELLRPLLLNRCSIQEPVHFVGATATTVLITQCVAPEILADRVRTRGDLNLKYTRVSRLRLSNARIGGSLVLTGANVGVKGNGGPAIVAERLIVDANLAMNSDAKRRFVSYGLVALTGSRVAGQVDMSGANLYGDIKHSALIALAADELRVGLGFSCGPAGREPFSARGQVRLINADIGGGLLFDGACLFGDGGEDTGRIAFAGDGMRVGRSLHARATSNTRFVASGKFLLNGATIDGQLSMTGAHLTGSEERGGGFSLAADRVRVAGAMLCGPTEHHQFRSDACIRLLDSAVGGQLSFNGACLKGSEVPENGYLAFIADSIEVGGDLVAESTTQHRVAVDGQVRMQHARVLGRVIFAGVTLRGGHDPNHGKVAIYGDGMQVRGNCRFMGNRQNPTRMDGQVRLPSAAIGGQLAFSGTDIDGSSGDTGTVALNIDGIRIERDFICETRGGVRATFKGQVRLQDASVAGRISLAGASIQGSQVPDVGRISVYADGLASGPVGITSSAGDSSDSILEPRARLDGEIRMSRAHVSDIVLINVVLCNADSVAFNGQGINIDGVLNFNPSNESMGILDLINARARHFEDHIGSWPPKMDVRLDGFSYETLPETRKRNDGPTVAERLAWLTRNAEKYTPGPYQQIAHAYRVGGFSRDAGNVGIAQQKTRFTERANDQRNRASRVAITAWSAFIRAVVGYGYRPLRTVSWFFLLWSLSTGIFAAMYVLERDALQPRVTKAVFAAPWYALDVLLPVVDLGQADQWSIIPWDFRLASQDGLWSDGIGP